MGQVSDLAAAGEAGLGGTDAEDVDGLLLNQRIELADGAQVSPVATAALTCCETSLSPSWSQRRAGSSIQVMS